MEPQGTARAPDITAGGEEGPYRVRPKIQKSLNLLVNINSSTPCSTDHQWPYQIPTDSNLTPCILPPNLLSLSVNHSHQSPRNQRTGKDYRGQSSNVKGKGEWGG